MRSYFRRISKGNKQTQVTFKTTQDIALPLSSDLDKNISNLQMMFSLTPDLIVRRFQIKSTGGKAALVYLDELTDRKAINSDVLHQLMHEADGALSIEQIVTVGGIKPADSLSQIEQAILQGKSVLMVDGSLKAQLLDTQGWPQRAIEDPQLEASLKDSHQGFVETGSQNIAMIRRYLPNRELKIKEFIVGKRGI